MISGKAYMVAQVIRWVSWGTIDSVAYGGNKRHALLHEVSNAFTPAFTQTDSAPESVHAEYIMHGQILHARPR